jgi:hypothetical protein
VVAVEIDELMAVTGANSLAMNSASVAVVWEVTAMRTPKNAPRSRSSERCAESCVASTRGVLYLRASVRNVARVLGVATFVNSSA